jgi:hypothetical protein
MIESKNKRRNKMKVLIIVFATMITLVISSCEIGTDTVVDSPQDTYISNLSFTVGNTYLDSGSSRLVASGTVKNNGSTKVTSPWYVEGQFYTTKTSYVKLGGSNTQIGVPLSSGQSTLWTLYFSSSNVDVRNYPNFGIKDLRGIYK